MAISRDEPQTAIEKKHFVTFAWHGDVLSLPAQERRLDR